MGRLLITRGADVSKPFSVAARLHACATAPDALRFFASQINARDRANQHPLHRAATTGNGAFLNILLRAPEGRPKTRLNTADRAGNTPLHLALESGHGEAAVILIEAGADRERVSGRRVREERERER